MKNFKLKVSNNLDDKLVNEWKNLWKNSENANFFNSYEWFLVCMKTYKITSFKILLCYQGNTLVALFPGTIKRRFGIPAFTSVTGMEHIPRSPLLIRSHDSELIKYILDTFSHETNIFLSHVNAELAKEMKKADNRVLASAIAKYPSIALPKDPESLFSKRAYREIRNKIKRNRDSLSYHFTEVGELNHHHLETLITIDQKSAKKHKGGDAFSNKETRELFQNILSICPHFVRIAYLYFQSKPIAYMFNFVYKNTALEFHTAYLQDYAKESPGKILFYKLINDLSQKSYRTFEFGLGFMGLYPAIEFQYDIYYSQNMFIRSWWKLINLARRTKQVLFHRDFFEDYKFLFRVLK